MHGREAVMYNSYECNEGMGFNSFFQEENIRSALNYKPRDGDVFLVTYPKCGTTWMQYIATNILTRGMPPNDIGEFSIMTPNIDVIGARPAENPSRIGPITTHLPPSVFKPVDTAKYIYVTRNPYDCAVSYYHFALGQTPKSTMDVSFERFLDVFISGKVRFGNYFDHLLPWYERRHNSNVLFITYEDLQADTPAQVLRVADFLGEEHGKSLREDQELFNRVLEACSLENMKPFFKDNQYVRRKKSLQWASKLWGVSGQDIGNLGEKTERHEGCGFVRKGIVGDWKNYFTPDQIKRTKNWIAENTVGSDVMQLWNAIELP
ncbi:sulfotransferase ssu-1-like [Haemaphysalis longicornis]